MDDKDRARNPHYEISCLNSKCIYARVHRLGEIIIDYNISPSSTTEEFLYGFADVRLLTKLLFKSSQNMIYEYPYCLRMVFR